MFTFYILAFLGFLISLLFNIASFNSSARDADNFTKVSFYFKWNFINTLASLIFTFVLCFLLNQPGSEWIIKFASMNQLEGSTPFQVYLFAFLIGLCIDQISYKVRGIINPVKFDSQSINKL
jgi:hypothetical protein